MATAGFYKHDGPYSWIVLVVLILNTFSTYGFMAGSVGLLGNAFPDVFDEDQTKTNIISSVAFGVYLFSMPFETLVMKVVGCRVIAAAGTVMCLIGITTSAFASEIWQMVLSYGVVSSMGMSLCFVSTFGVIPHYFHKRKTAAYAGIGLGVGIGLAAYPTITTYVLHVLGFKYGMLSLNALFIFPVISIFVFKPQLPKEGIESATKLLTSYARTGKHFVTAFFIVNSALAIGARAAIVVLSFSYISKYFDPSVAVLTYSIYGISFMVATLLFTLYALKFHANYFILHLTTSLLLGIAVCLMPVISKVITLYIVLGIIGTITGAVFGFKGNLIAHLFPTKDIAYMYGLTEAAGGIGSFVVPLSGGYIESKFGLGAGFYFVGACNIFSSVVLCLAALIRPKLWQEYNKREVKNHKEEVDAKVECIDKFESSRGELEVGQKEEELVI